MVVERWGKRRRGEKRRGVKREERERKKKIEGKKTLSFSFSLLFLPKYS
jgi:hypothetical protein